VKVGVYARVSKAEKDDPSSIPVQLATCRKRAEKEGWEVVAEYKDLGKSGWNPRVRREHFERLLSDVELGRVDAILCREIERLLRQMKDGRRIVDLHESVGFHRLFFTLSSDIDLRRAQDRKDFYDRVNSAEFYSAFLGEKIRDTMREQAEEGEWKSNHFRPYGYEQVDGTLVINEDEAAVVREAASRILADESRTSIIRDFESRGIRTYTGKPWTLTRLAEVVRSPTITALRVHLDEVVAEGKWEPILERATWERVGMKIRRAGPRPRGRGRWLLTGIARCGRCGEKLSSKRRSDRTRVMKCASDSALNCGALSVVAEPVERIVLTTAWAYAERPSMRPELVKGDPAAEAIEEKLAQLVEVQGELTTHRRSGILDPQVFVSELRSIAAERETLESDLASIRQGPERKVVFSNAQALTWMGIPENLGDLQPEVVEFWRGIVEQVYESVIIKPASRGQRFNPERVVLVPHNGYEDAAIRVADFADPSASASDVPAPFVANPSFGTVRR